MKFILFYQVDQNGNFRSKSRALLGACSAVQTSSKGPLLWAIVVSPNFALGTVLPFLFLRPATKTFHNFFYEKKNNFLSILGIQKNSFHFSLLFSLMYSYFVKFSGNNFVSIMVIKTVHFWHDFCKCKMCFFSKLNFSSLEID